MLSIVIAADWNCKLSPVCVKLFTVDDGPIEKEIDSKFATNKLVKFIFSTKRNEHLNWYFWQMRKEINQNEHLRELYWSIWTPLA